MTGEQMMRNWVRGEAARQQVEIVVGDPDKVEAVLRAATFRALRLTIPWDQSVRALVNEIIEHTQPRSEP